jgi:hypothetical protein
MIVRARDACETPSGCGRDHLASQPWEMPGSRSAFGGTMCNPYATDRDVGGSSGGPLFGGSQPGDLRDPEEGAPSIRMPSRLNNGVGLSQSQGLVSRDGMIGGGGLNDRNGAACRTVEDVAKVLDVIAGYDPADDLTVHSVGRVPKEGYASFARATSLKGIRIRVLLEYMDKRLLTQADDDTFAIEDRPVRDLRKLDATIVDPGAEGAVPKCIDQHIPRNLNALFIREFPTPAGADHIEKLRHTSIRALCPPNRRSATSGPRRRPSAKRSITTTAIQERGDANIKDLTDHHQVAPLRRHVGPRYTFQRRETSLA